MIKDDCMRLMCIKWSIIILSQCVCVSHSPRSVLGLASSCLNLSSRVFSLTVMGGAPDAFWSEMRATRGMMGRTGRDCCFCRVLRSGQETHKALKNEKDKTERQTYIDRDSETDRLRVVDVDRYRQRYKYRQYRRAGRYSKTDSLIQSDRRTNRWIQTYRKIYTFR